MGTKMAASFANIFMVKIETTLIQQSETKLKNQRPVFSLTVSKFAFIKNGRLLQERSLGPKYQISTEEAHFHGGGSFLRRKLISTEEAHFYGGSCFLWRKADFYRGGSFLRRKLISTQEADFH